MSGSAPVSVIETPEFLTATCKLVDEDERALLVDYLAQNPTKLLVESYARRRR